MEPWEWAVVQMDTFDHSCPRCWPLAASPDMSASGKSKNRMYDERRRARLQHPAARPTETYAYEVPSSMSTQSSHINTGHCTCPECSRLRLAARDQAAYGERERAFVLDDMRVNAGGHPVEQPSPPLPKYYAPHQPSPHCDCPTCKPGLREKRTTRAQRDAVADLLAEHYAAGTIDDEEFTDRVDTAMAAKFPSVLAALTTDLPDLPKPESPPQPDRWRPHNERITVPLKQESARYRRWSSGEWTYQNVAAVGASAGAVALSSVDPAWAGVSVVLCCLINVGLGARKSKALGWVGLFLGLFLSLGTVLMVMLTWRNPDKVRHGSPGERDW
jgi:Domain of unknown function (DUF1707)